MSILKNFWREEEGQDLIEYTLLLAFVCLGAAAVFITTGGDLKTVWQVGSNRASQAASAAVASN